MSELFVMKHLVNEIQKLEERYDVRSSADSPLFRYRSQRMEEVLPEPKLPGTEKGSFLPCHYFDFIGGTGVGG